MASRPLNLRYELDRYKTFQTWSNPYAHPLELASSGFYYTNVEDFVKCFVCGLEMGHWEMGDDPFIKHQMWQPNCPFVQSFFMSSFHMPEDFGILSDVSLSCPLHSGTPQIGWQLENPIENSLEMLGINETRAPLHTMYVSLESRLHSFKTWPVSMKNRPEELSEAGFFYTGSGDRTVCFHCGGGLANWMDTDDPWVEHAKWSPKCSYVLLNKGRDFVKSAIGDMTSQSSSKKLKNVKVSAELRGMLEIRGNPGPSTSRSASATEAIENPCNQEPAQSEKPEPVGKGGKFGKSKGIGGKGSRATASKGSLDMQEGKGNKVTTSIDSLTIQEDKGNKATTSEGSLATQEGKASKATVSKGSRDMQGGKCSKATTSKNSLVMQEGKDNKATTSKNSLVMQEGKDNKATAAENSLDTQEVKDSKATASKSSLDMPEGKGSKATRSDGPHDAQAGNGSKATTSKGSRAEHDKLAESKSPDEKGNDMATSKSSGSKEGVGATSRNADTQGSDFRLCKICWQEQMSVAFLPCGHLIACVKCASSLVKCAVCRQRFSATMRVYLP